MEKLVIILLLGYFLLEFLLFSFGGTVIKNPKLGVLSEKGGELVLFLTPIWLILGIYSMLYLETFTFLLVMYFFIEVLVFNYKKMLELASSESFNKMVEKWVTTLTWGVLVVTSLSLGFFIWGALKYAGETILILGYFFYYSVLGYMKTKVCCWSMTIIFKFEGNKVVGEFMSENIETIMLVGVLIFIMMIVGSLLIMGFFMAFSKELLKIFLKGLVGPLFKIIQYLINHILKSLGFGVSLDLFKKNSLLGVLLAMLVGVLGAHVVVLFYGGMLQGVYTPFLSDFAFKYLINVFFLMFGVPTMGFHFMVSFWIFKKSLLTMGN